MTQSRTGANPRSIERAPATASKADASSDGRRRPLRWASPSPSIRYDAELDPAGQAGQPGRRHDGRPTGAQIALVVGRMPREEGLGDGQVDHGITQEFEPLVVTPDAVRVLVVPARMDQCLLEQFEVADGKTEPGGERFGGSHDIRGPTGRLLAPSRWSARRCSRPRPGRCGSSPRPRPRSRSRTPLRGS